MITISTIKLTSQPVSSIGQLVNALCVAVGLLLIMTGDQNQVVFIYGYATLIGLTQRYYV